MCLPHANGNKHPPDIPSHSAIVDAKAEDVVEAFQERYITHPAQVGCRAQAKAVGMPAPVAKAV